jgi:hypothetical protein
MRLICLKDHLELELASVPYLNLFFRKHIILYLLKNLAEYINNEVAKERDNIRPQK